MFPMVQTGKPFGVFFASAESLGSADVQLDTLGPIPEAQLITTLKEQYDSEPLMVWRANLANNKTNSNLLVSTLLTEAKKLRSKKLGVWKPEQGDELEKRANKLSVSDKCIADFLRKLDKGSDNQSSKRRKLTAKT